MYVCTCILYRQWYRLFHRKLSVTSLRPVFESYVATQTSECAKQLHPAFIRCLYDWTHSLLLFVIDFNTSLSAAHWTACVQPNILNILCSCTAVQCLGYNRVISITVFVKWSSTNITIRQLSNLFHKLYSVSLFSKWIQYNTMSVNNMDFISGCWWDREFI